MTEAGPVDEQVEARLAELRRRWSEKPSPRAGLQLAEELRRASRLEESQEILERSLDENPGHLSSLVALGKTRLGLDDPAGAARNFEQVVDRDPTHLVANKFLIEAHLQQSDAESARRRLEHYRLLNAGDPEIESVEVRIAELALSGGNPPSDAEEVLDGVSTARIEEVSPEDETEPEATQGADEVDAVVRASNGSSGGDPFPALGLGDWRRYLEGLRAAGIFPLPSEPEAEPETTPEPESAEEAESVEAAAFVTEPEESVAESSSVADLEPAAEPQPLAEALPEPVFEIEPVFEVEPEIEAEPLLEAEPLSEPEPEPEIEAETVSEPAPATEPEPVAAVESVEPPADTERSTSTLGEIYLSQGHLAEAARVFRQVLAREPADESAAAGLEETLRQQRAGAFTAGALMRWATEAGAVNDHEVEEDRQRSLLEAYRARLRARSEGEERTDVP